MKRWWIAASLALAPAAWAASSAQDVADRFIDALRRDDAVYLATVLTEQEPGLRAQTDLRETLEMLDCISIARVESHVESEDAEHLSLRIDLEGTGVLKAAWHPVRPLPRRWFVDAQRTATGWRISRALTAEHRLAQEMAAAPIADVPRIFASATDIDPARTLRSYVHINEHDEHANTAFALAQSLGDVSTEVYVGRLRAITFLSPNPDVAVAVGRANEDLARRSGGADDLALALLTNGYLLTTAGDVDAGVHAFEEGAQLVEHADDPLVPLKCLYMEGWALALSHRNLPILGINERLEMLAHRYQWEEGEEQTILRRALVHHELGDVAVAHQQYEKVIRLSRSRGNPRFVAYAEYNLALLTCSEKRLDRCVALARDVIATYPSDFLLVSMSEMLLIDALQANGAAAEAEAELENAKRYGETKNPVQNIKVAAELQVRWSSQRVLQGRTSEAIDLARDVITRPEVADNTDIQSAARYALAQALRAAGQKKDAILALEESIALNAEANMGSDAAAGAIAHQGIMRTYSQIVELLVEDGRVDEAFRAAEHMKGRALRESISQGHIDRSASMSAEERAREETLERELEAANRELFAARAKHVPRETPEMRLDEARRALEAFRSEIVLKHPDVGRRRVIDVDTIALPPGSESMAVLAYVLCEKQTIAFVVTAERGSTVVHAVRIPAGADDVDRDAQDVARLIGNRSRGYIAPAQRLSAMLVAPLERYFAGKKIICVIPDGSLWGVPFHALPASDGELLIDRYSVFYAHSLGLLRNAEKPGPPEAATLLALGNPVVGIEAAHNLRSVYRDVNLGSLDDAEAEVKKLGSMYSPSRSRTYLRERAGERAFKREAPEFRILHLAAHAIVDDRSPMYSAIALATSADAGEDGLLEAREIADLPLQAELTVLSACDTARGKAGRGEGVLGLSWAFAAAGCPTTVVSQWKAESKATSILMIEFHRRLLAGESPAAALRGAQLALRKKSAYAHPFYWAPFVAIGSANRSIF